MIELLQAANLAKLDSVRHGFTTRQGGVSRAPFDSLNLRFDSGDDNDAVRENFARVGAAIGVSVEQFVMTAQTHSTNVRVVRADDAGTGVVQAGFEEVDGLITNEPGLILTAYCADCALIFVVDPVLRVVGLAHAGRVGTEAGMAHALVDKLRTEFGCMPADLICAVSPCICGKCYEIDIKLSNFEQLVAAGVLAENIFVSEHCTCEETERFFSYRACKGGKTGRQIGVIGLK